MVNVQIQTFPSFVLPLADTTGSKRNSQEATHVLMKSGFVQFHFL